MAQCAACDADNPDQAKFCLECGAAMAAPVARAEVRKTVTVLFCDVTGSTSLGERLDAEAMRSVMTRYFAAMRRVVESHGGTVEKFIGDAVMAVFGIPVLHEDDALRAVRSAVGMRGALEELNEHLERDHGVRLATRIGVNTGVVVVGTGTEDGRGTVATGDAVNVAARLEQSAGVGEIVLGPLTWDLVRGAVRAEPVPARSLKGKAEVVRAWRLLDVDTSPAAAPRVSHFSSPLVGRRREVQLLEQALDRSAAYRRSQQVTVLGAAGVGKSRLVAELVAGLDEHAIVLSGRCLSYGEDIVFWPLLQMLRQAAELTPGGDDGAGRQQLRSLLADDAEADRVVERLAPLAGLSGTPAEADETQWAVRRLVEALGRRCGAVVVVLDDVHWAEPALLDVVEHLADWTRDTPLLLVCLARPEFLDMRPQWGGGKLNATNVLLEPLDPGAAADLLDNLLGGAPVDPNTRTRILDAAGGMPLFVEQMLAMLVDDGFLVRNADAGSSTDDLTAADVPPSITALLAARLDRLPAGERATLQAAAVIGMTFYRDAVDELTDLESGEALMALTRKELVRPVRSVRFDLPDLPDQDNYRFLHILVRDAAYAAMSKARRAELHERFADWMDKGASETGQDADEFVAHHLERAVRLRDELGPLDTATRELAVRGAARFGAAARHLVLADPASSGSLSERAAALLDDHAPARIDHLRSAAAARMEIGDFAGSRARYEQAQTCARAIGDERRARLCLIDLAVLTAQLDPGVTFAGDLEDLTRDVAEFRAAGDDEGVVRAGLACLHILTTLATWGPVVPLARELLDACGRTGDVRARAEVQLHISAALFNGPEPVEECLAWMQSRRAETSRTVDIAESFAYAATLVSADQTDKARVALARAEELLREVDNPVATGLAAFGGGIAYVLLGEWEEADRILADGLVALSGAGERGWASSLAPMHGEVRLALGDLVGARTLAELGRDLTPPMDRISEASWRALLATVESREGRDGVALALADEAVDWIDQTDDITSQADVRRTRAEVLEAAGRRDDAAADLRAALGRYERKGNRPRARQVRGRLAEVLSPGRRGRGAPSGHPSAPGTG